MGNTDLQVTVNKLLSSTMLRQHIYIIMQTSKGVMQNLHH